MIEDIADAMKAWEEIQILLSGGQIKKGDSLDYEVIAADIRYIDLINTIYQVPIEIRILLSIDGACSPYSILAQIPPEELKAQRERFSYTK